MEKPHYHVVLWHVGKADESRLANWHDVAAWAAAGRRVDRRPGAARRAGHPPRIPEGAEPWASDYLLPGQSFELRLTVAGIYDYFCVPHEEAGMVGRIVVGPPSGVAAASPDTLPEAARGILPPVEDIVRRGSVSGEGG